ncbi:MAG: hypothetical protein GY940_26055 [bacterium]|nr:hypothetical protein [bacterium]
MDKQYLDEKKLIETIEVLKIRIEERFENSGLIGVSENLLSLAKETGETVNRIQRPIIWLRVIVAVILVIVPMAFIWILKSFPAGQGETTITDAIHLIETGSNVVILIGAAIIFLVSIETRTKRRKVIAAVNKLRAIAHVIDAFQLRKDPNIYSSEGKDTDHSPSRVMDNFSLGRYLDYCSELLALTGKIGFLYVQNFPDSASVQAVNDLETLTNGLSRKIWQKLIILKSDQ